MATLEKIRSKAALLVTAIGIALFAFIITDFLRSGSTFFQQSKEKVVVVNGQSISIQNFQTQVEEMTNMYKNRNSGNLTEEQQNQVRQAVFEEMVGSILLNEASEKIGFAVGKDELTDLIMGDNISPVLRQIPDFQDPKTGAFDRNSLLQFLQTIESDDLSMYPVEAQRQILGWKNNWLKIEKSVREQKLVSKFSSLVVSAIVANSLDAKAAYDNNAVSVDFNFAMQPFHAIPDSQIIVTDAEIKKLYNERKESYKQEKAKIIDFIAVNIVPSPADYEEVAQLMDKLRLELKNTDNVADIINDNSDIPYLDVYYSIHRLNREAIGFVESAEINRIEGPVLSGTTYHLYKLLDIKQAPDSIKINQLNLPNAEDTFVANLADSLIQVVKSGKSFADMALEATNGQGNGDIGWQTEENLVRAVDVKYMNKLFDAKLGDVFLYKSSYGNHLVQVAEKTQPVKKYKVATVQIAVVPSTETYNKLYNDLNQYISKNNTLEAFKQSAEGTGFLCQTNVPLYENQSNISGIENSRQVIRWAYSHKKGNISDIFECQDYFVVAAVEGAVKEGVRSLEDSYEVLKRELINEKKGEKIVVELKSKSLSSLEDYAQAMATAPQEVKFVTFATQRITGIGADAIVNAKALLAEPGQLVGPFAGKNAVYVLSLTDKKASEQAYDETTQKQQLNMQNSYQLMSLIQGNVLLKESATIKDNRSRFY